MFAFPYSSYAFSFLTGTPGGELPGKLGAPHAWRPAAGDHYGVQSRAEVQIFPRSVQATCLKKDFVCRGASSTAPQSTTRDRFCSLGCKPGFKQALPIVPLLMFLLVLNGRGVY
jgi:hypothetical protein